MNKIQTQDITQDYKKKCIRIVDEIKESYVRLG
jgi:hypothetical protein